jgi:ribosome-binding protein aMBF1 (putative translation factor)
VTCRAIVGNRGGIPIITILFGAERAPLAVARESQMIISGEQVIAARKLLGWSRSDLAGHSGVSSTTIANFETGRRKASVLDLSVIRRALDAAEVEFIADNAEGPGVRLRTSSE